MIQDHSLITSLQELSKTLTEVKTVVLISHLAPDGDTLGSVLALKELCNQLDNIKTVDTILYGDIPAIYSFLHGSDKVLKHNDSRLQNVYDLAIAVDIASPDRLGGSDRPFYTARKNALIDHHETNPHYAKINIVNASAAATGELIYDLAIEMGLTITPEIATNIYTAILTDTGGFKFANTSARALEICSILIKKGADPHYIYRMCYDNRPLKMLQLHSHCILNVNMAEDNRVAYSVVTRDLLNQFNTSDQHTDGIVEFLRQIDTAEIAILFKETMDGNIKVSFRSKKYNVCQLAEQFKGGGHKLAAGCTVKGLPLDRCITAILTKVKFLLQEPYRS